MDTHTDTLNFDSDTSFDLEWGKESFDQLIKSLNKSDDNFFWCIGVQKQICILSTWEFKVLRVPPIEILTKNEK
jgi:hypothetical protein